MRYRSTDPRLCNVPRSAASRHAAFVGLLLAVGLSASPVAAFEIGSRLSGSFGLHALFDDDLRDTYGMLPLLGLRFSTPLGETSEFFVGTGYGWDTGDPYYGETDFIAADRSRLRTVPIEIGARLTDRMGPRRAFYLGAALEYLRVQEETPVAGAVDAAASGWQRFSGWGWGGRLLAGPEWRIAGGRYTIGGEVSLGLRSLMVRRGHEERRVTLSGLATQVIFSTHL